MPGRKIFTSIFQYLFQWRTLCQILCGAGALFGRMTSHMFIVLEQGLLPSKTLGGHRPLAPQVPAADLFSIFNQI